MHLGRVDRSSGGCSGFVLSLPGIVDILPEFANAPAQCPTQVSQFCRAEHDEGDYHDEDQMRWLKQAFDHDDIFSWFPSGPSWMFGPVGWTMDSRIDVVAEGNG
jgi:hypothetical protein